MKGFVFFFLLNLKNKDSHLILAQILMELFFFIEFFLFYSGDFIAANGRTHAYSPPA